LAIFDTLVPLTSIIKFVAREQSRRWIAMLTNYHQANNLPKGNNLTELE
jgi:hypothetical protein